MSVSLRRAQSKPSSARPKTNKNQEHEDKPQESTPPVLSSTSTEISSMESTPPRHGARSKAGVECSPSSEDEMEKTLTIMTDDEQSCTRQKAKVCLKRKRELDETGSQLHEEGDEEDIQPEVEIDPELDRELENKSKQHNLTSANVRSIIHEVITNEHVVAMMKAAINETEPVPVFEPKMTRSKLKEVVEKGVVIPTWNISPIKKQSKVQGPQFVDIPLEEEEDSSDEEYCPDDEEEDETGEETLLESDLESTASSPRGTRLNLNRSFGEHDGENSCSPRQSVRRSSHVRVEVMPMGPPPPPQRPDPPRPPPECSFMEKLHAVDEELAIGTDRMNSFQSLTTNGEESLMAFRTRSKRPLRDVPLGRLEAELRAPDITPDMYEFGSAPEDREWTRWLQGLMNSDVENEEEGDDDDDPEYNFLADIDEPDVEDYRNDKAVRITKKEVNDLMEELFDAFQDELGGPDEEGHEDEEEKEEDDTHPDAPNILETIPYQNPLADILNQSYPTVKEQLVAIRKHKAVLESKGVTIPPPRPKRPSSPTHLFLDPAQKLHLQQHIQQHVQLLTQMNMLSRSVDGLKTALSTSRQFLSELHFFAQYGEQTHPGIVSIFRACNLQGALSLLEELDHSPVHDTLEPCPVFPGSNFSAHMAWLMATRPIFLYPQLLPTVKLRRFNYKSMFTPAENCLVVLGHHHLKGTLNPLELLCHYLLVGRKYKALRLHIHTACHKQKPNIMKKYFLEEKRPPMPLACGRVDPSDQRPPVERESHLMPRWLSSNLKLIYEEVKMYNLSLEENSAFTHEALSDPSTPSYTFPLGTRYPPVLPDALAVALKPPPLAEISKKRSQSVKTSKPPPSLKVLEQALSRLPPILPKCADQTVEPSQFKPVLKNLPSMAGPNVTNLANVNQGKLILTLSAAPLIPSSLGNVGVNHGEKKQTSVSSAAKVAPTNQGNIIMALPTAFICPAPVAKVVQTPPVATPVSKEHMSQRCGTLLRLSLEQGLNPVASQNQKFLLLPTGCVVTKGAGYKTASLNTPAKCVAQEELLDVSQTVQNDPPQSGNLIRYAETRDEENQQLQESSGKAEEDMDGHPTVSNEEELEEFQGDLFREPFLTLSESSGSPTPSLAGEDDNVDLVVDGRVECDQEMHQRTSLMMPVPLNENGLPGWTEGQKEQENTGGETELRNATAATSDTSTQSEVLLQPRETESQGWNWNPKHPTRLSDEGKSLSHVSEEVPEAELHEDDTCDDDPRRDVKDVAFAQAYLEKVCEALQVVPGKVEEFLSVLYEFERSPEDRTAVELFMRLKPVLSEWPELLRDFAAFLHPEQAQECGLAAEQQAFERSRRFLRQLELSFGEHSVHYRKVVRTLQHGLPKTLSGSEEMKAQIAMLFRDHAHLLEEYWVFFEQLHPGMLRLSDDEEEGDTSSGSSAQTVQAEGSELAEPVRASSSEEGLESPEKESCIQRIDATSLNAEQLSKGAEVEADGSPDCNVQSYPEASQSPVCAKNISHMPSGEKVVLWTREADRVILTTCQEKGASQSTFTSIAAQLGNKTADQVGARYLDLVRLFHKSTKSHHTMWLDPEAQFSPEEEEPD